MIGGGIGAAIALLFAPKSGIELRNDIADTTRKTYDTALEKATVLKERSAEVVDNVRSKAGELYLTAADKASTLGEIANNVLSDAKKRTAEGMERFSADVEKDTKPITGDRKQAVM